jgi:hypothetical protein
MAKIAAANPALTIPVLQGIGLVDGLNLMKALKLLRLGAAILSGALLIPATTSAQVSLGEASPWPANLTVLPRGAKPLLQTYTGSFVVNTDSREQVRNFYNAIYPTSVSAPINSTANVSNCVPGTNALSFQQAALRRINWFRALAGEPANVVYNSTYNSNAQQMAVMISANGTLNHMPPTNWSCYTADGASVSIGNQAIGDNGAEAVTSYIWDFGASNSEVGHRRWILYPQEQIMGTGDVPPAGTNYYAANLTYVFDASINGTRPATRQPYVAWPPEGFVPYQVIFPYWSFALTNANFTNATVTMRSNGVSVAVSIQPYLIYYGENTLVWVPMGLDATSYGTTFPFNGTDTVYSITVSNINYNGNLISYSYNVTAFDPTVPGTDYVATAVSGTNTPYLNTGNAYACTPLANTNTTGYQWLTAQLVSGNLVDNATNGLANFTISPTPLYPVITNPPVGTGKCFHLCHTNPVSQFLQLNEVLFPATNATVSFKSLLGYATTDETARVQASADGGADWQDLYVQAGTDGPGESTFTAHSLSLSNYVGQQTLLRFNYALPTSGAFNYYYQIDNYVGWCLTNIVVTNVQQFVSAATNSTVSTNFTYTPVLTGSSIIAAAPVLFSQFPLNWGPFKQLTVMTNPVQAIVLGQPVLMNGQLQISFTISGAASTFHLLQTTNLTAKFVTNSTATLTTNVAGSSYRYTATNAAPVNFYRVQSP